MSKRREILKQVTSVPALPDVVMQLRQYCNDDDVGYGTIAKIIERDQALTAGLLRLANSVYFGGSDNISSVQLAMTRLGLKRVYQMALTISLAPIANVQLSGYGLTPEQMWEHSLATAMIAEILAESVPEVDAPDAYTAGLLHDMGKIVLSGFVDVDIDTIKTRMREENLAFDEAEFATLGVDHASIAGALLKRWQVPSPVHDAVRWHHRPGKTEVGQALVDVVHVSDALCINVGWGGGDDGLFYRIDDGAVNRLGVGPEDGERIVARVMMEIQEIMDMFKVPQEA
jgi:putative nucleotidyltransferase with HDIG domain